MTSLETLYSCAEKIAAAKDLEPLSGDYSTILSGVRGDAACRRLSSQFISRFFPKFPSLSQQALDAMLDLCEDDDLNIRKQAIKDLPSICREAKEYLPKVADVLSQLLQAEDASELGVVQTSLLSLLRKDAKGTLLGLFSQIRTGPDLTRERAVKFLHLKMKLEGKDLLPKDAEVTLFNEIKGCLADCTAAEFQAFMAMLKMTTIARTVSGQAQLLEVAAAMADLDKPLNGADAEAVDKFVQCAEAAATFFSTHAKSARWVDYMCAHVVPQLALVADAGLQGTLLRLLAEACTHCTDTCELKDPLAAATNVHAALLEYMPLPPDDPAEAAAAAAEPQFEFTKVECLLLAYHTVARKAPEHLNDNADVLKDFRLRLQYFARGVQGYIKKLREFLSGKSKAEDEGNKLKAEALRCTLNIQMLIKDLFHTPPIFKAKIVVSWKKPEEKVAPKRAAIHYEKFAGPKKPRGDSGNNRSRGGGGGGGSNSGSVYQPPTGKYSTSVDGYRDGGNGGGRRGGGGGRYRGGRQGGRW